MGILLYIVTVLICGAMVEGAKRWALGPVYSKPRREPTHAPGFEVIPK